MPIIVYCLFLVVAIVYATASMLSYNEGIRNSYQLLLYGLPLSLLGASLWYTIIKILDQKEKIFLAGIYWDVIVAFSYTLIPVLFFNLKLNLLTWVGVATIFVGLLLVKLSS